MQSAQVKVLPLAQTHLEPENRGLKGGQGLVVAVPQHPAVDRGGLVQSHGANHGSCNNIRNENNIHNENSDNTENCENSDIKCNVLSLTHGLNEVDPQGVEDLRHGVKIIFPLQPGARRRL